MRSSRWVLLLCSFWLAAATLCQAQATANLGKLGWYADPEIRVFAGQYWIYPTSSSPDADLHDIRTFNPLQRRLRSGPVIHPVYLLHTSLDALSSPDLVHWTKHPDIFDVRNVNWAAYAIWAPSAIHLNGKYYLFFAANDIQKDSRFEGGIGVAVSEQPDGPFLDLLGKPLVGAFRTGRNQSIRWCFRITMVPFTCTTADRATAMWPGWHPT